MSVISATREYGSLHGPTTQRDGSIRYSDTWVVVTNNPADNGRLIAGDLRLPQQGQAYANDPRAICISTDPVQETDQQTVWRVHCEYDSKTTGLPDPQQIGNPLGKIPVVSFSTVRYEESTLTDLDGKAFSDAAGTPFDPAPTVPRSHLLMTIAKNQGGFDSLLAWAYTDTVNSDAWLGFPKFYCRMAGITANEQWEEGIHFWAVTYQIEFARPARPWIPLQVLNVGSRYRKAAGEKAVVADDKMGVAHNGRVHLNEDGTLNDAADAGPFFVPTWMEFRVYETMSFNALNIF